MINQKTDFFAYVDNFAKIEGIESIKVFGNEDSSVEYTIAIPTYKRTEYLKEAINSALNQDCSFLYNVIVVDNNPERDDDTEKMMESYKSTKNLSYYKNAENLGMAGNWNRLFQLAQTEWVVMLHDDDVLYPYYLSVCDDIVNANDKIDILKPREDNKYNPTCHKGGKLEKLISLDFYYGNRCATPSGMLFKRKSVIEAGGYNQDFYPSLDYCFHTRFASLFNIYLYDEYLMYYRIGVNDSLNVSTQKQWLIDAVYLIRQLLKKHRIPDFIINSFLARRTVNSYMLLQKTFKKNYSFELADVGLKKTNFLIGLVSHAYIKIVLFIIKRNGIKYK